MTDPLAGDGPGAYLRKAREEADMSVDKVATALLLNTHTVKLLEADTYASLPAPTFVRGYLRGYARVLGLPSGPILDMYDRQGFEPPPLTTEVNESTQAHTSDTAVRIVTYAVAVALALLVGLWWHSQEDGGFGVAGDLFEQSPDAGEDPSLPATEKSGTAPDDRDAEGGPVGMASGPADELARDGEFPEPAPGSDAEFGGRASDADATADAEAQGESGTSPGTSPGTLPGDEASTATHTVGDATPGEVATDEFGQAGAEADGEVAAPDTAPAGETAAMASTRPSAAPGGEGSAVTTPVEQAVAPGDIVEVAPASAETSAPDATTDGETSAAQESQPEADAGDNRTAGATLDATADTGTGQSGLVLEFVHESWVEVYDGERARLFFGLVQPGRVLTFDGPQPYDVLLGFGKDVRVAIDGRAFDHTPYLKHGVARFSVGTGPGNGAAGAG